ncbi:MAG: YbjQ family protein [bacterium]
MSVDLIVFLVLLAAGYLFGQAAEQRHYRSILRREQQYLSLPALTLKKLPPAYQSNDVALVTGSVVVSIDYFKRFVAGLRTLFGGRVRSYESLLDRGRREALLRMKESAASMGAEAVANVRIETSSIAKGQGNSIGSIEVLAYGTALRPLDRE